MGKIAFIFPGQGSQAVGMGKTLIEEEPVCEDIFKRADEKLGYSLTDIMLNGPEEALRRTEHTQPALVTMSVAVLQLLKEKGIEADYVAGHSLGEYSALTAANSLSFEDAVFAVRNRGLFMEEAVPFGEGAMAAVLGLERDVLEKVCKQVQNAGEVAELANLNCPGQIVISGSAEGVKQASEQAKEAGAKRVIPLQVSGPFHSSLMKPAAEKLHSILDTLTIQDASVPVIANVTAGEVVQQEEIRKRLVEQVYSPVLWEDSVKKLLDLGVDTFIEVGSGNVLTGLVKKVNRRVRAFAVNDRESLMKVVEQLEGVTE
ncbi:ACP S-malonyltransferase [Halalkalibacter urbisdiaboli]|uniref:ACP S-malonyltransferase n=1 Tax=Halalkalibacter urbisdiaboli TaxID=1960589 RepID=UPI000B434D3D|nr:ACP S-malonyltransferase [Halalkalibacter urbisdiaboli]